MNAIIVTIGDEILIGQVVDTNSAWIGGTLSHYGIDITEKITITDEHDHIKKTVAYALNNADLVFLTGGLGPTKDDVTKKALADFFGADLVFSQETKDWIKKIYANFGIEYKATHDEQCFMPSKAQLLHNEMGTAPGMLFRQDGKMLVSMPGVPFEMKHIISERFIPIFKKEVKSPLYFYHKTIMTSGMGESSVASKIDKITSKFPNDIGIAFLPSLGSVRLRVTGKSKEDAKISEKVNHYVGQIVDELQDLVFAYDNKKMEQHLLEVFKNKGLTLVSAESCTGGYFSHKITSVPGSSAYFLGGFITYSNEMKEEILKVDKAVIRQHGAVSQEVVEQMVKGALMISGADIAVSISGIAGPGGGSEAKPVGTIWMSIGSKSKIESYLIKASKSRVQNIEYATSVLMNKLRHFIKSDN